MRLQRDSGPLTPTPSQGITINDSANDLEGGAGVTLVVDPHPVAPAGRASSTDSIPDNGFGVLDGESIITGGTLITSRTPFADTRLLREFIPNATPVASPTGSTETSSATLDIDGTTIVTIGQTIIISVAQTASTPTVAAADDTPGFGAFTMSVAFRFGFLIDNGMLIRTFFLQRSCCEPPDFCNGFGG
jgi:hypothetical protein